MAEEYTAVTFRKENKEWLEAYRDRIAKDSSYPRKVSLDEAFTALRVAYEQRQKLNLKDEL